MAKIVLVIENDKDISDLIKLLVEGLGHEVILEPDCMALEKILLIAPDIILLDHWLNQGRGGDLCREIKAHKYMQDVPVVLISAFPNSIKLARESVADAFIEKPFDIQEVEDIIKSYLN
ncbi:MAG: response regulator [Mucilaginibacter sp.]|jgi:DNA-binding response OmpR family regulator